MRKTEDGSQQTLGVELLSSAAHAHVTVAVHVVNKVADGQMTRNDAGRMVNHVWAGISVHYPRIGADTPQVMLDDSHALWSRELSRVRKVNVRMPARRARHGLPRGLAPVVPVLGTQSPVAP